MYPRIKRLRAELARHRLDAFLVTKSVNITYLTNGFPASESWMLIGSRAAHYLTDSRYHLEARHGLPGIAIACYSKSMVETFVKTVRAMGARRVGFDDRHVTLAQYRVLKKSCQGVQLVRVNDLVENFRAVKDPQEIIGIRRALKVHKQAHDLLKNVVKPGISEQEILNQLEAFVRSKGAVFSFPPIVASGANSCYPHAKVTQRRLRNDEPVLIDMGIDVKSYKSDLTRMFFLGRIAALVKEVHAAVAEAQQRAIVKIRAGVPVAEVDDAARNYLLKKKLAKYFGHALGHGVGLEIHENPRLARTNQTALQEGMIITVEPAVYLPGKFGIRLEEMVLVRKNDCEVLSDDIY